MFTFQLASDDRLHFASKAIYRSNGFSNYGILILTDKILHFGDVSTEFHIKISLKNVTALIAEILPDQWPPTAEKECLRLTADKQYEFMLCDTGLSETWKRKILQRPSAFQLHSRIDSPK